MKSYMRIYNLLWLVSLLTLACNSQTGEDHDHDHEASEASLQHEEAGHQEHQDEVHFSAQQFQSLSMKVDTLPFRNISSYVEANGQLEVPPQNEASITAIIGANVQSIKVIEGDEVKKGQVLAYLSHPDLIRLQTDYLNNWNQLQYWEKELKRQQKLYEEKVGSGKELQKAQADFLSLKGNVQGLESQLKLLALSVSRIQQGKIYEQVPVRSPIDGYIRLVEVKTGQFVQPQTEMFEIVNIDHIHADLMVYEKDMYKVKKGQQVKFTVVSLPDKELEAKIYAVGKSFEEGPKAIHLHAEIENKEGLLLPGMYVRGRIMTDDTARLALPEGGVVRQGDKYYIFKAKQEEENGQQEWAFEPVEVVTGTQSDGWIEVKLLAPLEETAKVAWNNAYYLLAEMKKGETEHSH
ncbi:efflux RND transporter periplasmic adaptor subunit [Limibacter armeniacum]|uniref:efflux RND transporter periplasmic adaptor subunit n=1 Tax=Limibacter armeniacum TaxID=466084 RepID=UPI002FE5C845